MKQKLSLGFKALRQLGWAEIGPYLSYRFQLHSGILRWRTRPVSYQRAAEETGNLHIPLFPPPQPEEYRQLLTENSRLLLKEADQIVSRQAHLFGGKTYPLSLNPGPDLRHWTQHTANQHRGEDIKLVWEPARFGWATRLARAYLLSGDQRYAASFWLFTEEFLEYNPPNIGPHWASGQEVALRLMALAFSVGLFVESPYTTSERLDRLKGFFAAHANRIAATLDYARAQNNNHLVSEAAGLYTAAALLPDHPHAENWRKAGGSWLNYALQTQINPDGTYIQHSTNYLRLVLQLALFVRRIAAVHTEEYPEQTLARLAAATRWLEIMLDAESGRVPNLGGNDGAYFLPLTTCPYSDFRPVLDAARHAFLGQPTQKDEMSLWLAGEQGLPLATEADTAVYRLSGKSSWGVLRAAQFNHRPAHADQLHLDLWWQGINAAADPGVYQYNASPPWRNPLDHTSVHNTLTINGLPQMTKAGQFLWLDWAQAEVLDLGEIDEGGLNWIVTQHDGYRKLDLAHRRTVSVEGDMWMVRDQVLPIDESLTGQDPVSIRLHWLLPDWAWQYNNGLLFLDSGRGDVTLQVRCADSEASYSLVRAGECLLGDVKPEPYRGWFSPTYAQKVPALSFAVEVTAAPPLTITTNWAFPD
ncbi:MAG: alginate lyase family protein [Anaerolineales bacterium]|nr:alginate lyase family protein [Anaerolineales bacterium]